MLCESMASNLLNKYQTSTELDTPCVHTRTHGCVCPPWRKGRAYLHSNPIHLLLSSSLSLCPQGIGAVSEEHKSQMHASEIFTYTHTDTHTQALTQTHAQV